MVDTAAAPNSSVGHIKKSPPSVIRQKKKQYLLALSQCGSNKKACEMANVHETQPFQWINKDEDFAKKYAEAKELGEKVILGQYESKVDQEALDKEFNKVTGVLTMFRMKKLDPAYRDNSQVHIQVGPSAVHFDGGPQVIDVDGKKVDMFENGQAKQLTDQH